MARSAVAYADELFEVPTAEEENMASDLAWMPVGSRPEGKPHGRWQPERTTLALSDDPRAALVVYEEPTTRRTIEATEQPRWLGPTIGALMRALELPDGWNSYRAPRIQARAVNTALDLLRSSAQDDSPPPIVVPTAEGGVQLEWHAWGLDVELDVSPVAPPQLFFRDRRAAEGIREQELTTNLEPLHRALKVLAERAVSGAVR